MAVLFFLFLYLSLSSVNFLQVFSAGIMTKVAENPLSARASVIRYWKAHVSGNLPPPPFLLSKASPLNAMELAKFTRIAAQNNLSSNLGSFCSSANLLCSLDNSKAGQDPNFALYSGKSFSGYGSSRIGGVGLFKNYSDGLNTAANSFNEYSGDSVAHTEEFKGYAKDVNVATDNFTNYGSGATGGSGDFTSYDGRVNVPNLGFILYDSDANSHKLSFSSYTEEANAGAEAFTSYGKNGNAVPSQFNSYSNDANNIRSDFTSYGVSGNVANDSFKGYGDSGNTPHNNFKTYGVGANSGIDKFTSYLDGANSGDDTFQSYTSHAHSGEVNFANYGKTFNPVNDTFKEYGRGSFGDPTIGFKTYGSNPNFIDYHKKGVTFSEYTAGGISPASSPASSPTLRWVEPGKFFRESMLKEGSVMVMPDLRDKMPRRSFLPRPISIKLPFSSSSLPELMQIFHAEQNSSMGRVLAAAVAECERAPSRGETKQCVGTIEDMIDFSSSILGRNIEPKTTETVRGSKQKIVIGKVRGINGGQVTKSVSCHQSLYPYLLYYCHSVPQVRVYEAEILEVKSRAKINRGVAICHIDTSAWGPGHGAFVALGSGPGQIEVCHWIFENDMTWTIAN
ncbi:hypothetical protein SLE2022_368870 [Rubroshorea leprosula]